VKPNPLLQLKSHGQSIWYDNIRRSLLQSGELKRMIEEDGVTGVTSNPTIFEKAIDGSTDYQDALKELIASGASPDQIYEKLTVEDVRTACDILRPVFDNTHGADGYVSLEVSPLLAHNTAGTIKQAKHLFALVGRPNLMIKVPATSEGIPAIETLIGDGVNVNVTLIFSLDSYRKVAEAYISGLERLEKAGGRLDAVASVASFFVSRLDTAVDRLLEERIATERDPKRQSELAALLGTAAISNSKMAYQMFKEIFGSPRFQALAEKGARPQRVLWASTSTKNPAYRDVIYVEQLIGPQTVNTMPPNTLEAFRDHGVVKPTLEQSVEEARANLKALRDLGIDLDAITDQLLVEGVDAFAKSFEQLMRCIATKKQKFLDGDDITECH